MIKPDGLQRRLVGNVISRFEAKGLTMRALKMATPTKELLEEHYKEHKEKSFFTKVVNFMISGPVVCMVGFVRFRDRSVPFFITEYCLCDYRYGKAKVPLK